jgi:hypothetical protein
MRTFHAHPQTLEAWSHLYSGDSIPKKSARGIVEFKSCLWVVSSAAFFKGVHSIRLEECVPEDDWKGKITEYPHYNNKDQFSYKGNMVSLYSFKYVLTGECIEVKPDPAIPFPKWKDISHRPILWPHIHPCPTCKKGTICDQRKPTGAPAPCTGGEWRVCETCVPRDKVANKQLHKGALSKLRKKLRR